MGPENIYKSWITCIESIGRPFVGVYFAHFFLLILQSSKGYNLAAMYLLKTARFCFEVCIYLYNIVDAFPVDTFKIVLTIWITYK